MSVSSLILPTILFFLGGYACSLAIAVSYACSRRFTLDRKIALCSALLFPLVGFAQLVSGLAASGEQLAAVLPSVAGGLILILILSTGLFTASRWRALAAAAGIVWTAIASHVISDYAFLGSSC